MYRNLLTDSLVVKAILTEKCRKHDPIQVAAAGLQELVLRGQMEFRTVMKSEMVSKLSWSLSVQIV